MSWLADFLCEAFSAPDTAFSFAQNTSADPALGDSSATAAKNLELEGRLVQEVKELKVSTG